MIREIIRPSSNNYNIHIPEEYIDKEIEILILPFSYKEKSYKQNNVFDPKVFYNVAKSTKEEIDTYLKNNKNEWDNYIWIVIIC